MTDITLTFGKYRNQKLSEVPTSYVKWLSEQDFICGSRNVPLAAKAFLNRVNVLEQAVSRFSKPTTLAEIEKLGFMAEQNNGKYREEAGKTLLDARDENGMIKVIDEDGDEVLIKVIDEGRGRAHLGSRRVLREGMDDEW